MRVKEPDEFLEGLADFLNTARPSMTEREWRFFLKRNSKYGGVLGIRSYFFVCRTNIETGKSEYVTGVTSDEAKDIRAHIHNSLGYLRADKTLNQPYAELIYHLNELKLETGYQCFPLTGKARPGKAILRSHGKKWVASFWPIARNTKDLLYTIIAGGLVNGTLNKLKACRECKKYIVVTDIKREFCSNRCKDNYFNRQKLKDGTFKTARRKQKLLAG